MIGARRRLSIAAGAIALVVLGGPAGALAQDGASDTGHKDAGESASAWDAGGWLFWTVIVIALLAVLVLALVFTARRGGEDDGGQAPDAAQRGDSAPAEAGPARPVPRAVEDETPAAGWELAVLGFAHVPDAEHAFAAVREHVEGDPLWLHDVAFAESHRHGRVLLRGTFAGRYVDVHDLRTVPAETPILQAIHDGVPDGGSGLVTFAPAAQTATLVEAFTPRAASVRRHPASGAEAATLAAAVARAPKATAPRPAP
jgi:hypothetical protein